MVAKAKAIDIDELSAVMRNPALAPTAPEIAVLRHFGERLLNGLGPTVLGLATSFLAGFDLINLPFIALPIQNQGE